jgi:biotin carboxyl carrier protein
MDLKKVTKLVEMLSDSQLKGLNYKDKVTNINIKKSVVISETKEEPVPVNGTPEPLSENELKDDLNYKEIKSEVVGLFYPTVEKRQIEARARVVKGTDLFYVKAMNLENHKKLEYDCKIVKYLVEPGKAVEYGQPLVLIEEV